MFALYKFASKNIIKYDKYQIHTLIDTKVRLISMWTYVIFNNYQYALFKYVGSFSVYIRM